MSSNNRGKYTGYTDARRECNRRYREKYVEIRVRMLPEEREELKERAAGLGVSVNTYILGLIQADMPEFHVEQSRTEELTKDE